MPVRPRTAYLRLHPQDDLWHGSVQYVPHQSAPDWIKNGPLSTAYAGGDANGYVDIDKHTLQHVRYPNVFARGDAGSSPNSKTVAAIRKQATVVVENIDALLAEFDYAMQLTPSIAGLDPTVPHRSYWYLKKYGLPALYWNLMLKGPA